MKQMNNIPLKTKLQKHFQTLRRHLQEASPERFFQALGFIPLSWPCKLENFGLKLLVWPTLFFLDFELEEWRKKKKTLSGPIFGKAAAPRRNGPLCWVNSSSSRFSSQLDIKERPITLLRAQGGETARSRRRRRDLKQTMSSGRRRRQHKKELFISTLNRLSWELLIGQAFTWLTANQRQSERVSAHLRLQVQMAHRTN